MANPPNEVGLFAYFRRRLLQIPPFTAPTSPATILLIGANSDIGLAAAKLLLSLQGLENLLLTTRSKEKSLQTRQHLAHSCPASANIETFEVDLADLQVNYISTALLSLLLLPNLRLGSSTSSSPSRLSICSSDGHYFAIPISTLYNSGSGILDHLNEPNNFSHRTYPTSKLLGILFGRALSGKLNPAEVLVTMINPGIARTKLFRDLGWPYRIFMRLFGRNVHAAAQVVVQGALGGSGAVHGGFYSEARDTKPLSEVFSERGRELQERLWSETLDLLRTQYGGSTSALAQVHTMC